MIRAVFDTGVVVSALLFRSGPAARVRDTWRSGAVEALVAAPTLDELLRVLAYPKFGLTGAEIESLLAEYVPWSRTVEIPRKPAVRLPRCRDRGDQVFLELAAAARADVLVSGDRDLLALADRVRFAIESVARYLARFRRA